MTQHHQKEIETKDEELDLLRKTIENLKNELKKEKLFYEKELEKKSRVHQNDKDFYESELSRVKKEALEDYTAMNDMHTKEKLELEDSKQRLLREIE